MQKYNIYAGLGGSFGGPEYKGTVECEDQAEADDIAYEEACAEYESYEGLYGLRSVYDIAEDQGLNMDDYNDYEVALDIYQEEREDWIEYYAILEEEDEDLDPEDKYEL